jgi:DNA-binding NarL/FixJ family response regulator
MPRHIFLTRRAEPLPTWLAAFPEADILSYPRMGEVLVKDPQGVLVWVHIQPDGTDPLHSLRAAALAAPGCRLVVLSNVPGEAEGAALLEAGAAGYTNSLSVPELLQQIATVVESGGLWVGPELMQRLMAALAGLTQRQYVSQSLDKLSNREREVALAVARGESNKEVARNLGITERTVKAHLTSAFEHLGVRDRLQLSILLNGIPQAGPPANLH